MTDSSPSGRPRYAPSQPPLRRWQSAAIIALLFIGGAVFWAPAVAAWRTEVLLNLGQLDAAESWLGRAEWLGLDRAQADFFRGTLASRRRRLAEAARWLRSAAAAGYAPAEVKRAQRVVLAQAGRFAELGGQGVELLAHPGADASGIYRGFVIYALANGLTDDAGKVIARWTEQFPTEADPHRFAGLLATVENNWQAAEKAYRRGHELAADDHQILRSLASCLMNQLKFSEAKACWHKLLEADPESPAAVTGLADCQSKLGDTAAAAATLKVHAEAVANDADAAALRGRVSRELQDHPEAVSWYEKANRLRPESTEIKRLLAQAYRLNGQADRAESLKPVVAAGEAALAEIRRLNGRLAQEPRNANLRYRLGELTWRWQSRAEGLNWMRVVLRVDPRHEAAKRFLADHDDGQTDAGTTESLALPEMVSD